MMNLNNTNSKVTDITSALKAPYVPKAESLKPLRKKCPLPEFTCNSIWIQADEALPFLIPGQEYTARDICGEVFWVEFLCSSGKQKQAGKCLAHMVKQGYLPLKFAGYTSGHSRLYRLK